MATDDSFMQGIANLDFTMVKRKLMDADAGEGWSQAYCDRVCEEYKRFLALKREAPEFTQIVPSSSIDTFWHYHILDTRKYAADCHAVFGFFLHHYPYYGMRGGDDVGDLQISWVNTRAAYFRRFVEEPDFDEIWRLPMQCS